MGKNYALQNQIYLYSLQTDNFYNDDEKVVSDKFFKSIRINNRLKEKKETLSNMKNFLESKRENEELIDEEKMELQEINVKIERNERNLGKFKLIIDHFKQKLNDLLQKNTKMRELRVDSLKENKAISLFESTLTRTCGMKRNELTDDMFVVRIFHYPVMKSLLDNGFMYNGKHYSYFTSSAGQIRTKKTVFINTELYAKHENKITCELPPNKINEKGGINTNKYQAYLALSNSASIEWKRFNIDRMIVVDDICTEIDGDVDYIDRDTYEITRKRMNVPVEHMDGCGIMLPSVSKKSYMFRMPWMKGLLTTFDFKKFALLHNQTKITDIYGKEYDIIEDNINIILTKSQFKLWKYYDSWEDYKTKFKKYNCEASKLNIEDIGADANLNYQMLQTLPSMTVKELTTIAQDTIDDIVSLGSDKSTMLRVLGATKENTNKNYLQKALLFYPELLSDNHSKQIIKDKKKSLVKDARHGKLRINGKYTYIIPDVYAFCEWLFLGIKTPRGLLKDGEVYCDIYGEGKVDILRSPHLYKEHAIKNSIKSPELEEWFTTKGVYTSTYDLISKMLQFDK